MDILKKHFHLLFLILLAMAILPIAYYFLYLLPSFQEKQLELQKQEIETKREETRNKQAIQDEEKQKEQQRVSDLNSCLAEAKRVYNGLQDFLFQKAEESTCKSDLICMTVNMQSRDEIKVEFETKKNECFKLYGN